MYVCIYIYIYIYTYIHTYIYVYTHTYMAKASAEVANDEAGAVELPPARRVDFSSGRSCRSRPLASAVPLLATTPNL